MGLKERHLCFLAELQGKVNALPFLNTLPDCRSKLKLSTFLGILKRVSDDVVMCMEKSDCDCELVFLTSSPGLGYKHCGKDVFSWLPPYSSK